MSSQQQLADRIRAVGNQKQKSSFSLNNYVTDASDKFQSLCTPTQIAIVVAIIHLAVYAYQYYKKRDEFKKEDHMKTLGMVAVMLAAVYYLCDQNQTDMAWGVVAAYVLLAVYGYVKDPVISEVDKYFQRNQSAAQAAHVGADRASQGHAMQGPMQAEPHMQAQVANKSGLIIEQDQGMAYDPSAGQFMAY